MTEREGAERSERGVDEARERDRAGGTGRDVVPVGIPAEAAAVGGGGRRATVEEVREAAKPLRGGEGEVDGEEEEDGGGGGHEVGAGRRHFGWAFSLEFWVGMEGNRAFSRCGAVCR